MSQRLRMRHAAFPGGVTREGLIRWYRDIRRRTGELFSLITPDAYYDRPIALRNPIVFYEGHFAAFAVNTLIRAALRQPGIDAELERLFERGIDPGSEDEARPPTDVWPSRERVLEYVHSAEALIERALSEAELEDDASTLLRNGQAVFTILEHEQMHQETLLYMLHNLPFERKRRPTAFPAPPPAGGPPARERIRVPRGTTMLGNARGTFGWDNEFPAFEVAVEAFEIDADDVTNGDWLEFMSATGAPAPHFWIPEGEGWKWRGMFDSRPLPLDAPVSVTHEQATAYCRWKGARLPSEAEFHRAAFGTPSGEERLHPWGDEPADPSRGNFDFASWEPQPVGSYRDAASAWGVRDLVGNGWEWTSTLFTGFPGFEPMPSYPQYSADFFDGAHYVMKGASRATARQLIRSSFRNWFRPNYPYMYATFRCVRG